MSNRQASQALDKHSEGGTFHHGQQGRESEGELMDGKSTEVKQTVGQEALSP